MPTYSRAFRASDPHFIAPPDAVKYVGGGEDRARLDSTSERMGWVLPITQQVTVGIWWNPAWNLAYPGTVEVRDGATLNPDGSVTGGTLLASFSIDMKSNQVYDATWLPYGVARTPPLTTATDPNGHSSLILGTFTPKTSLVVCAIKSADNSSGVNGPGNSACLDTLWLQAPAPILIPEPARINSAVVGPAGKTIALFITDQAGNPSNVSYVATNPTISVNGGAPVTLTNPIYGSSQPTPYVVYPLSSPVGPGDAVTLTAPDAWGYAVAGAIDVADAIPVTQASNGTLLPPLPTTPRTLGVGFNVAAPNTSAPVMIHANLARRMSSWSGQLSGADANGYPTGVAGGYYCSAPVFIPWGNPSGDGTLYVAGPSGTYTVQFRSTTQDYCVFLNTTGGDAVGAPFRTVLPDGRIRVQQYVTVASAGGPGLILTIRKPTTSPAADPIAAVAVPSFAIDMQALEIYPPGVDPDNPPLFHPEYLRMASGAKCLRFMDALDTNTSAIADFAQFASPTLLSYVGGAPLVTPAIVSIGPYANADNWCDPTASIVPVLLTFGQPHGIKEGQCGYIAGVAGPNGDGTFPVTGGTYKTGAPGGVAGQPVPDTGTQVNLQVAFHYVSPTQLAFSAPGTGWAQGQRLNGTFTTGLGACYVVLPTGQGMPPADCVALCNTVGADLWLNVPHCATDACVAALAQLVASRLRPGLKWHLELSNETWNYGAGFAQSAWFASMGRTDPGNLSGDQWYVKRAGQVFAIAAAAMSAAGRGGDLVRVLGTQAAYFAIAQARVGYAVQNNIAFDVLAPATYFHAGPEDQGLAPIFDTLDQDQLMDLAELFMGWGGFSESILDGNAAVLKSLCPTARIECYEGGPEFGGLTTAVAGSAGDNLRAARSRAWVRHPRMRNIMLRYLQALQDHGCTLFNDYMLSGHVENVVVKGDATWADYIRWNQPAGMGDGSDGLFDNRTNYEAIDRVVSVVGGALAAWNTPSAGPAVTPTRTLRLPPRRNSSPRRS